MTFFFLPFLMVLGVTGKIGSGKSEVARIFKKYGADVIDADKICHHLYRRDENLKRKLVKVFGKQICTQNGQIERQKLRAIVFRNENSRKKLNHITHPTIAREIESKLKKVRSDGLVIIEAFEFHPRYLGKFVNKMILVSTHPSLIIRRLKKRKIGTQVIRNILKKQKLPEKADFEIKNNDSKEKLEESVRKIMTSL